MEVRNGNKSDSMKKIKKKLIMNLLTLKRSGFNKA